MKCCRSRVHLESTESASPPLPEAGDSEMQREDFQRAEAIQKREAQIGYVTFPDQMTSQKHTQRATIAS